MPRNPRYLFNIHLRYSNNDSLFDSLQFISLFTPFSPFFSYLIIPFSNEIGYIVGNNNNNNHQYNLAIASNLYRWYRGYSNWPIVTDFTRRFESDIPPVLAVISKSSARRKVVVSSRQKKSEKWYCQSNLRRAIRPPLTPVHLFYFLYDFSIFNKRVFEK